MIKIMFIVQKLEYLYWIHICTVKNSTQVITLSEEVYLTCARRGKTIKIRIGVRKDGA